MKLKQWIAITLAAVCACALPVLAGAMNVTAPGTSRNAATSVGAPFSIYSTNGHSSSPCNFTNNVDNNFLYEDCNMRFSATLYVDGALTASGITAAAGGFTARNATAGIQIGSVGTANFDAEITGTIVSYAPLTLSNAQLITSQYAVPIADNGAGTNATRTISVGEYLPSVAITCSDTQGCDVTLGETSAIDGETMCLTNVSSSTVNFADTAGVSELAGAFAAGQWDMLCVRYITDRWVEMSRSNN